MNKVSAHTQAQNIFQQRQQADTARVSTETAHGSAAFASEAEINDAELYKGALLMGRSPESGRLLRYGGNGHALTFAPTGSGKSVSVVVPNLLDYEGSVVCIDPKGAIAAVTAKHRQARGHNVILLDPFGEVENSMENSGQPDLWEKLTCSTYNPFSSLDPEALHIVDDVRVLAGSLIVEKNDKNRYFSDSARAILEGLMLFLLAAGGRDALTIESLLDLAFDSRKNYELTWLVEMRHKQAAFGGKIGRLANQMEDFSGEGGAAIWSTLRHNLGLLDTDSLRDVMKPSSLDFRSLKVAAPGDKPTTVYLVLPAHALHTHGVWLRLMMSVILRQLSDARPSKLPVLFLVDECATLGRLEVLESAVGLMRGYGMKLWLIFQDLPQLKTLYEERWSSFISNSGVRQFFNVNDTTTAEFVSEYLGKQTLYTLAESHSGQGQIPGTNIAAAGRPLLTPDEVGRFPEAEEILFYQGQKPVRAAKLCYYEDSEFKSFAAPDPYIIGGQ